MMVSDWLKGRVSFQELYDMPAGKFHFLHAFVLNESRSEKGKEKKEAEVLNDQLEESLT